MVKWGARQRQTWVDSQRRRGEEGRGKEERNREEERRGGMDRGELALKISQVLSI